MTPLESPWGRQTHEVLAGLDVNSDTGLPLAEVEIRHKKFGRNLLKAQKKVSALQRFLSQLKSPVVITLLVATLISALLGDATDAIAIAAVVVINAAIGYFQESKAEAAVEALKKLSAPRARVLRSGNITEIAASDICIGDILVLEAGDYVAADSRIIHSSQLSVDEAILTGESLPVEKKASAVSANASLAERRNMLFASTAVATGSARAVVTAIGMQSEIGRIAGMLEADVKSTTPLQERLSQVSNKLLIFCAVVVVAVGVLGLIHGEQWLDVLMIAISLAVAAIPEGLPTVVTLALALAIRRMTKRNVIVRHLPAVETLGSTSVICTDKTGTLTTGKMRVRDVFLPAGGILAEELSVNNVTDDMKMLIATGVLCSNAEINDDGLATGDPTEVALLYLAKSHNISPKAMTQSYSRLAEWSFNSNRKRMSVAVKEDSRVVVHCKGAPEAVLPLCGMSPEDKDRVSKAIESLSLQGRRILAVARKVLPVPADRFNPEDYKDYSSVESDLTFLGLVAIADPPRQETIPAIEACKAAGIKVVMITGDHPATAKAIATELGIIEEGVFDRVLTGADLDTMPDSRLAEQVEKVAVYARVSPEHKLKIVQAWKDKGNVVAMTGDGVNDAPALKQASIGISMGKGGTEVARQASSMILTDDNFATIVSAVEEGRAIYGNIRRTIQYLLSGNLAEILVMLGAAIAGWPVPLAPIHLLWINLVTDGLPSLALAAEPVPKDVLRTTKKPSPSSFFDRDFYKEMAFVGIVTSLLALGVYGYSILYEDEMTARTHVFSFLVFAELFRSFACRSEHKTIFQMGFSSNLYHLVAVSIPVAFQISLHHFEIFQGIFKVDSIHWGECTFLLALTLIPVTVIEVRKWMKHQMALKHV
ncbi:MAG: cation-translocating P-type ATPase [Alphaproteobacteria bacterium]|nr:MAG: cation-translocating P-type ATPase [Alphaproteobacteria bacterium]